MKKYKLTNKMKIVDNRTLHQIKALRDITRYDGSLFVKKGELGGWIESESNLSHSGRAWVCEEASVFDNALVCGDAKVYCPSKVYGNAVVTHNSVVSDHAEVYGKARIYGDTRIEGNARVFGNARTFGGKITGNAIVFGDAYIFGEARIGNEAEIDKFADFILINNIFDRGKSLTAYKGRGGEVMVDGVPLEKFEKPFIFESACRCKAIDFHKEARAVIDLIKIHFK